MTMSARLLFVIAAVVLALLALLDVADPVKLLAVGLIAAALAPVVP